MLKIYSSQYYLPPSSPHSLILTPFWGNVIDTDTAAPDFGRMNDYIEKASGFIRITDNIEEADIALYPWDFKEEFRSLPQTIELFEKSKTHQKKVLVFSNYDDTHPLVLDNAIIFRTSFFKSQRRPNEFACPGWSIDFLKKYGDSKLKLRPKQNIPSVGYCGYIDYEGMGDQIVQTIRRELQYRFGGRNPDFDRGRILRGKAVRYLNKEKEIEKNFIIRKSFWGGDMDAAAARKEYAENFFGSDYALVVRGAGNFSYRLYEAMSCGRIPVFVNTDCVLPYEEFIDWKKYFVWIEEKDLPQIGKILLDYHRQISSEEFVKKQETVRGLYEEWISPTGFFKNLYRYLK